MHKHGYDIHNIVFIVIITSNTSRNLTRLICFVVAPTQVGASKITSSKIVAAAAIVTSKS